MAKSRDEIQAVVDAVHAEGRTFRLLEKGDGYLLQCTYLERDVESNVVRDQHSRKWYVSKHMTETEIVETAWACYQRSVIHQAAEHFTYRGRRVYSPHFKIEDRLRIENYDAR